MVLQIESTEKGEMAILDFSKFFLTVRSKIKHFITNPVPFCSNSNVMMFSCFELSKTLKGIL